MPGNGKLLLLCGGDRGGEGDVCRVECCLPCRGGEGVCALLCPLASSEEDEVVAVEAAGLEGGEWCCCEEGGGRGASECCCWPQFGFDVLEEIESLSMDIESLLIDEKDPLSSLEW